MDILGSCSVPLWFSVGDDMVDFGSLLLGRFVDTVVVDIGVLAVRGTSGSPWCWMAAGLSVLKLTSAMESSRARLSPPPEELESMESASRIRFSDNTELSLLSMLQSSHLRLGSSLVWVLLISQAWWLGQKPSLSLTQNKMLISPEIFLCLPK